MPSCRCQLVNPGDGSYGPWVAELEKQLAEKEKNPGAGAGRPARYPKCMHQNAIRKFTDGTPTLPPHLIPKYKQRAPKTEAGSSQSAPPKPQPQKRKGEDGGTQPPASKKQEVEPMLASREAETEPGGSQSSPPEAGPIRLDSAQKQFATRLARNLYTFRAPDTRENHLYMSEVLIAQRSNGEPQGSGWLKEFVQYKGAARRYMYRMIMEEARKWRRWQGKDLDLVFPWEEVVEDDFSPFNHIEEVELRRMFGS